ncbi:MAG: helix-turn-helix transcriptional regulator [Lentisphaeria bacterium]|nr:helix-turn-helix transcriptional regulator [Lentisphaeria bacterium]
MNLVELAKTIRRVRQQQGMTVDQLAKKSGFSKGFISQVENFRQTPSVKALSRIADALGLPLSELFSETGPASPPYSFGNLGDGEELMRDDSEKFGIRYFSLAHRQVGRRIDPFIVEYTPTEPRGFLNHDAEEFFVLLEGSMNYYLCDDNTKREIHPGDTLYLQAMVPHRVELLPGCEKARALIIYAESGTQPKE